MKGAPRHQTLNALTEEPTLGQIIQITNQKLQKKNTQFFPAQIKETPNVTKLSMP